MATDKLTQAIELTKSLIKEHNLIGWKVALNNRKNAFGVCNYSRKTIFYSRFNIPHCTDDSIFNTVTHEVAHAIAGAGTNHGLYWQKIHKSLGGNGERKGSSDNFEGGKETRNQILEAKSKYKAVCCNGHVYYKNRLSKSGHSQSCGKCSSRYDERYKLKFVLNQ